MSALTMYEPTMSMPSPGRLLLVEDSGFFRRALTTHLQSEGFEVVTAENGADAIQLAGAQHFDLVILDLHMPRLNGMAALRILRSYPATKQTPVIVVSANDKDSDKAAVAKLGAAYCSKSSMTFQSLLRTIQASILTAAQTAQAS